MLQGLISKINTSKIGTLLLVLLLVQSAIHAPVMNTPAVGNHVWRQCNSLALARNYYEEDMNLLMPRIDKRYNTPGITGPAFPAYEYGLAVLYKAFGFSHTLHRWWSLLISIFALTGLFLLIHGYTKSLSMSFFGALALVFIPEFYYHSVNAVPDLLALCFMLWGWLFALRWLGSGAKKYWLLALLFIALAGLTKLQFLICLVPLAIALWQKEKWSFGKFTIGAIGMTVVALSASVLWQWYAKKLTKMYGLWEFLSEVRPPKSVGQFFEIGLGNVFSDIPETWVGYGLLPLFVLGMVFLFKRHTLLASASIAAACAYYFALQYQFVHHGYYTLVFSPFIAIAIAYGFQYLKLGMLRNIAVALFFLAPVWTVFREGRNWIPSHYRVPETLVKSDNQAAILRNSKSNIRYIVGPDPSGCVYFYYLHAKGFPWYDANDAKSSIMNYVKQGARGVITNQPELLMEQYGGLLQLKETARVGDFYWFEAQLKP